MKRITQTDVLKSNDVNGNIESDNKLEYSTARDISEFSANEIPPLSVVQQAINENIPPTEVPRILPWTSSEVVAKDYYRTHPVNGIEYLFRSLVDENISEPSLEDLGAWSRKDTFGLISTFNISTTYNLGQWTRIGSNNKVYQSKIDGNVGNAPVDGTSNVFWDYIGVFVGSWSNSVTYNLGDVVLDVSDSNRRYVSNVANNNEPLTDNSGGSSWQVVGVIISDDEVSTTKTWSSQKISDAIASTSGASSKGSFPSTDTGQSVINIPHGLTGIPTWFSIQGSNVISTGVINKSDLTVDATNIIITPEFMNNDGATLNFLWKAEL